MRVVKRQRLHRLGLPLLVLAALIASCDGGEPDADAGDAALADFKREVLLSIGTNVILPTYEQFVTVSAELETAAAAYAADPSEPNRTAAQDAWRAAMDVWELAELMSVGPGGEGGTVGFTGGLGLRGEIYSYDLSSTCRVDQETLEPAHADADLLAEEPINVRGLDALEYLLFVETSENTCSVMSPINLDGSWAAAGADGIRDARAAYAATVATLVAREAVVLRDAWAPAAGDFLGNFAGAGLDGSDFPTAQTALNELVGAMLYLDPDTRDMKLAEPAGIAGCAEATCPSALETPFAQYGGTAITINVRGFQQVYHGGDPAGTTLGWDDLLIEVGASELEQQMTTAIADAVTTCDAMGTSLQEAIANDMPGVMACYDAISEILRLFKADFYTALDVEPGGMPPSDND